MKNDTIEKLFKTKFGNKEDLCNILDKLTDYVVEVESERDRATERLREFKKDIEIQELKDELEEIRRRSVCIMTENESKAQREFSEEHYTKCNSKLGTSLILTGTGIGTAIEIRCNKCGEIKNITDYECW